MCKLIQDQVKTIYILKNTWTYHFSEKEKWELWACLCSCRASAHVRQKQNPRLPAGGTSECWDWVEEALDRSVVAELRG